MKKRRQLLEVPMAGGMHDPPFSAPQTKRVHNTAAQEESSAFMQDINNQRHQAQYRNAAPWSHEDKRPRNDPPVVSVQSEDAVIRAESLVHQPHQVRSAQDPREEAPRLDREPIQEEEEEERHHQ
jgi:hypothetical protein